jgi:hypothetical protein
MPKPYSRGGSRGGCCPSQVVGWARKVVLRLREPGADGGGMGCGFPIAAMQGWEFWTVSVHGSMVPIVLMVGAGVSVRGVGNVAEARGGGNDRDGSLGEVAGDLSSGGSLRGVSGGRQRGEGSSRGGRKAGRGGIGGGSPQGQASSSSRSVGGRVSMDISVCVYPCFRMGGNERVLVWHSAAHSHCGCSPLSLDTS